ncbi:MAG: type II TA system antitoxin MqsA family protein [Bryobacteraceae bacterium]
MRCLDCGKGKMERRRAKVPHEIRGVRFEVEDTVSVCSHCGSISIPLAHADEHGRLVDEAYRRLAGILTAEEIKAARQRLRMSQRQFAEYLGVGEASVKRWETGVLPDKSSSDLIRLKTDPQAALDNFKQLEKLLERGAAASNGAEARRIGPASSARKPAAKVSVPGRQKAPKRSSARL